MASRLMIFSRLKRVNNNMEQNNTWPGLNILHLYLLQFVEAQQIIDDDVWNKKTKSSFENKKLLKSQNNLNSVDREAKTRIEEIH